MSGILGSIDFGSLKDILLIFSIFISCILGIFLILWTIVPFVIFSLKKLLKEILKEQKETKKYLKSIDKIERKIDILLTSESYAKPEKRKVENPKDSDSDNG